MHQLYRLLKRVKRSERRTGSSRQSSSEFSIYRRRLSMEPLEDRRLLSVTLPVTNTLDSGLGSLRQAIIDANAATAPVTISFNIPATDPGFVDDDATMQGGDPGPDVFVIKPLSALPAINNPHAAITIDGRTQTAFGGDTNSFGPEIVLDGTQAGSYDGLVISSANNVIVGLNIQDFHDDVYHDFWGSGITISGPNASGNVIGGNYIGTDATGTTWAGNGYGVFVSNAPNNTIGGTDPGMRNIISGNHRSGIDLSGPNASENVIAGNYIGTNAIGTAAIGGGGIYLEGASDNTIGGSNSGARNIISGNGDGIQLWYANGNAIVGNYIGTDVSGSVAISNIRGIIVSFGSDNTIGGTLPGQANTIAYNLMQGVLVYPDSATRNTVRGNSVFNNGGLGIDLSSDVYGDGPTPNDVGDSDTGPNNLQNYPALYTAQYGPQTAISGTLNSLPNATFTLDFYANAAADPSGYGEGQRYLGSTTVTTDATGNAAFSVTLAAASSLGEWITATATDAAGDTSEFSAAVSAVLGYTVTNTLDSGLGSLRQAIINANAATAPVTISFNIPATDPGFVDDDATMLGGDPGPDVFVIKPITALPAINNPNYGITIDGTTQTTFGGDTNPFGPEIVLKGSLAGGSVDGLDIYSANNMVEGLNIQGFSNYGIFVSEAAATGNVIAGNYIGTDPTGTAAVGNKYGVRISNAPNNTIGGTAEGAQNVISGNPYCGIYIYGYTASGNVVEGNYIGTNAAGTAAVANQSGIIISTEALNNTIGGTAAGARNVISGNAYCGVYIHQFASGNVVEGNYIGTDATGSAAVANDIGVYIDTASNNTIGGTAAGARNVISGNSHFGVLIDNSATVVDGNYIGTDATGTAAVANKIGVYVYWGPSTIGGTAAEARNVISGNSWWGVLIEGSENVVEGNYIGTNATGTAAVTNNYGGVYINASNNTIGGTAAGAANVISGNTNCGVTLWSGTGNAVRGNAIYANGGLGIDLKYDGVTLNDLGDADTGPNNLQNFAVVSLAEYGAQTYIGGSLNSLPNAAYTLDFYANAAADPSGYGQGQRYLGSTSVTTDAAGNASFSVTLPSATASGEWISATATDAGGNTSEFSLDSRANTAAPVAVLSTVVNGANGAVLNGTDNASKQRSMVKSLVVTFNDFVTLDSGAFVIINKATSQSVAVDFKAVDTSLWTVATLTFSGDQTQWGSLVDGNYRLTIDATKVHDTALGTNLDGDHDGSPGGNYIFGAADADNFFRLFGDCNGSRRVDNTDFSYFASSMSKRSTDAGYLWYFDIDNSGRVDNTDFSAFAAQMNKRM